MKQIEIKKVKLADADGSNNKRIKVWFKFWFWMLRKRPTVLIYAEIIRPDGTVTRRSSHYYSPPWRAIFVGSAIKFTQKGTWIIILAVRAKNAKGTKGEFIFECE